MIDGKGMMEARLVEDMARQAEAAEQKAEQASARLSSAVPAYSASPDDIASPEIPPYPDEVSVEAPEEVSGETSEDKTEEAAVEPAGAEDSPEGT